MAKEQDDCHDENARQAMEAAEQRVKTAKDFGLDTLGSKQDRGGIPFGPQGRDTILDHGRVRGGGGLGPSGK